MPVALAGLARLRGFTTGGVTTVLDPLGRDGYLRGHPACDDRNGLVVAVAADTFSGRHGTAQRKSPPAAGAGPAPPSCGATRPEVTRGASPHAEGCDRATVRG